MENFASRSYVHPTRIGKLAESVPRYFRLCSTKYAFVRNFLFEPVNIRSLGLISHTLAKRDTGFGIKRGSVQNLFVKLVGRENSRSETRGPADVLSRYSLRNAPEPKLLSTVYSLICTIARISAVTYSGCTVVGADKSVTRESANLGSC